MEETQESQARIKSQIPHRKFTLEGEFPGHEGQSFCLRTKFPWGLLRQLGNATESNNIDAQTETIANFVISWDITNEEGDPLPQPHKNPDAFDELDSEITLHIMRKIGESIKSAKSLAAGGPEAVKNLEGA